MTSEATRHWASSIIGATLLFGVLAPVRARAAGAGESLSWLDTPRVGFVARADVSGGFSGVVVRSQSGAGTPSQTASGADTVVTGTPATVFTAARLGYSWDRQWVAGVQAVLGWSDGGFTDRSLAFAVTLSPRLTLGFRPQRHEAWEIEVGAGYSRLSFGRLSNLGAAVGTDPPPILDSEYNGVATHAGALYRFGYPGLPAALHAYCDVGYYAGFTSDVFVVTPRLGLSVGY